MSTPHVPNCKKEHLAAAAVASMKRFSSLECACQIKGRQDGL